MKLLEFNWNPTDRQLRQFGVIALVFLPLVGWLWGASGNVLAGLAIGGALLAVAGSVVPKALKPVFVILMLVAAPIGLIVGEVAMLLIYFGMFLPLGLFFRIIRRDALALKLGRDTNSYWSAKKQPSSAASYYRQS